jgi:hypothetical protein
MSSEQMPPPRAAERLDQPRHESLRKAGTKRTLVPSISYSFCRNLVQEPQIESGIGIGRSISKQEVVPWPRI